MPKQVMITPEVREVLAQATVEGTAERPIVVLPPGQLPRELYTAVDKVLKALGGKWDRRAQGHVFDRPVEGELAEALASGVAVDAKRTAEQFFTPPDLAARVVETARIEPNDSVLEPSAGAGALLAAIARAHSTATIWAVEQDERLYMDLKRNWGLRATIIHGDFLEYLGTAGGFDRVVMNPPFGRGADMAHVTRALELLRPGGVLVAIMSPHWTFAESAAAQAFRGLVNDHSHAWEFLPEGSFKSAGTNVSTGILTVRKGTI